LLPTGGNNLDDVCGVQQKSGGTRIRTWELREAAFTALCV
jgi:hypothetical protein